MEINIIFFVLWNSDFFFLSLTRAINSWLKKFGNQYVFPFILWRLSELWLHWLSKLWLHSNAINIFNCHCSLVNLMENKNKMYVEIFVLASETKFWWIKLWISLALTNFQESLAKNLFKLKNPIFANKKIINLEWPLSVI